MARKSFEPAISRHHIFFERRLYRKPFEREFRCHRGLIIPMIHQLHKDLHNDIEAPRKPLPRQMRELTQELDNTPYNDRHAPLWGVLLVKEYFEHEAGSYGLTEAGNRAREISDNIGRQLGYLAIGVEHEEAVAA